MGEGCGGWFRACAARALSVFNTLLTRCDPKVHNVFIGFSSRNQSAIVLTLQTSVALPLCALFISSLGCLFVCFNSSAESCSGLSGWGCDRWQDTRTLKLNPVSVSFQQWMGWHYYLWWVAIIIMKLINKQRVTLLGRVLVSLDKFRAIILFSEVNMFKYNPPSFKLHFKIKPSNINYQIDLLF